MNKINWNAIHNPHCLKATQNVTFQFFNFPPIFVLFRIDLPGNTVWPQASAFQKLAKMDQFWHFWLTFVESKCTRSSLSSQCLMRLLLWFSNTVPSEIFFFFNCTSFRQRFIFTLLSPIQLHFSEICKSDFWYCSWVYFLGGWRRGYVF